MKQFVLAIVTLFLLSCQTKKSKPELTIRDPSRHLGNISMDSTYSLSFILKNTGQGDLIIDTVSTSCDCSQPLISKRKYFSRRIPQCVRYRLRRLTPDGSTSLL